MTDLYYKPPTDEIFEEVRQKAIKIWKTYDDTYGYATEKIDQIKDIGNVGDNLMYIVSMFDDNNQKILAGQISSEAKKAIGDRIIDGGTPDFYNNFL